MDPETSGEIVVPKIEVLEPTQPRMKKVLKLATQTRWAIVTILLTALASGGSFYIALHPELIWEALNYPYAIAFLAAIPVTIFAIGLVWNFSAAIRQYLKIQVDKLKESKQSVWFNIAIACFILVSMLESGTFFGSLIKNMYFGYFVVLTVDLCAVQFMDARKKALMHSDEKKANSYMIGVWFTVIISAFANAYSSLLNFDLPKNTTKIPPWMGSAAPYIGVIFPLLIVFLAYTIDAEIASKDVVEKYDEQQDIRIRLLEAQERHFTRQFEIKARLALLAQKQSALRNIFFTQNKMRAVASLVTTNLEGQIETHIASCFESQAQKLLDQKTQAHQEAVERLLQEKVSEYNEKLARLEFVLEELTGRVPLMIEERLQGQQPEQIAEQVFLKLLPGVQEDVQKQITAALPQLTTVTEIKQEQSAEEWVVSKVKAKQVGFTMKNPIATIQEFTFTTFEEAANWMEDARITPEIMKKAYDERLIPSKYFRIMITEAFGKQGEHPVILLHAGVKKLLLKIK